VPSRRNPPQSRLVITPEVFDTRDPIARARFVYDQVNQYNQEILSDPIVEKHLTCKKGCSFCCHTQVSVTEDEATLLADLVVRGETHIDFQKLHTQMSAGNSAKNWFSLRHESRGCVFLDEEGACSIYQDRPSVCRTNHVVSDASYCDTSDGKEKPIRLLNTFKSDMVVYAAFEASKKSGVLASMLWEKLEKLGKTPITLARRDRSPDRTL
jgi:Fe-S-cluster containining protein